MGCAGTCVLMTYRVSMNCERDVLVDCLLAQVAIDVEEPQASIFKLECVKVLPSHYRSTFAVLWVHLASYRDRYDVGPRGHHKRTSGSSSFHPPMFSLLRPPHMFIFSRYLKLRSVQLNMRLGDSAHQSRLPHLWRMNLDSSVS
jgi:hypothetical protein